MRVGGLCFQLVGSDSGVLPARIALPASKQRPPTIFLRMFLCEKSFRSDCGRIFFRCNATLRFRFGFSLLKTIFTTHPSNHTLMRKVFLSLFALALLSSGCASIVSKSRYPVRITSVPDKTSFTITNRDGLEVASGVAPNTVVLKSGNGFFKRAIYTIKFKKEGYEDKMVTLESDINGWYFGNIVFGGFIGLLIVDPATGAMYRISEKEVQGFLNQVTGSIGKESSPALNIMSIDEIPADMRDALIKIN